MISKVDENLLRGPYIDPARLTAVGVKAVICLQTPEDCILRGPYSEDLLANKYGLEVHHYPLSDIWFPNDYAFAEIRWMVERLRGAAPTYVHCTHGVDRTGVVCAFHRVVVQGWTVDAALAEMESHGFHKSFYFWWERRFRQMIRRFTWNR